MNRAKSCLSNANIDTCMLWLAKLTVMQQLWGASQTGVCVCVWYVRKWVCRQGGGKIVEARIWMREEGGMKGTTGRKIGIRVWKGKALSTLGKEITPSFECTLTHTHIHTLYGFLLTREGNLGHAYMQKSQSEHGNHYWIHTHIHR